METFINGFSKLSREERLRVVCGESGQPEQLLRTLAGHLHVSAETQKIYDELTENSISNFFLPFSVAPNFLINGKLYMVPMVTEESSVVAAAAAAAKFWAERGGFTTRILSQRKPGHIHFLWKKERHDLENFILEIKPAFHEITRPVLDRMKNRGGGMLEIQLRKHPEWPEEYYQLEFVFNTADAMGANIINSCLEVMARELIHQAEIRDIAQHIEIIMSILSNFTPECIAECEVSAPVDQFSGISGNRSGMDFALRFERAVSVSHHDIFRAVTHNKGIFNGIDAVLIATGNDFRAVEAAGHAWASRKGKYTGLSEVRLEGNTFTFRLELPVMVGTVGGITRLHPMADAALEILGHPDSAGLMSIAAAAGLASNFSAIRALITEGIQQGHMRLHLINLLNQQGATPVEIEQAIDFFHSTVVTNAAVFDFLQELRGDENKCQDD